MDLIYILLSALCFNVVFCDDKCIEVDQDCMKECGLPTGDAKTLLLNSNKFYTYSSCYDKKTMMNGEQCNMAAIEDKIQVKANAARACALAACEPKNETTYPDQTYNEVNSCFYQ